MEEGSYTREPWKQPSSGVLSACLSYAQDPEVEEEEIEGAGGEPTLAPSLPPSCDPGPEVHELLSQRQEAGERQSHFPCVLPAQALLPPGRPRPTAGDPAPPPHPETS